MIYQNEENIAVTKHQLPATRVLQGLENFVAFQVALDPGEQPKTARRSYTGSPIRSLTSLSATEDRRHFNMRKENHDAGTRSKGRWVARRPQPASCQAKQSPPPPPKVP